MSSHEIPCHTCLQLVDSHEIDLHGLGWKSRGSWFHLSKTVGSKDVPPWWSKLLHQSSPVIVTSWVAKVLPCTRQVEDVTATATATAPPPTTTTTRTTKTTRRTRKNTPNLRSQWVFLTCSSSVHKAWYINHWIIYGQSCHMTMVYHLYGSIWLTNEWQTIEQKKPTAISHAHTQLTHFVAIAPVPIPHKTKPCFHGNDWPKEHWPFCSPRYCWVGLSSGSVGLVWLRGCSKWTKDPLHSFKAKQKRKKTYRTIVRGCIWTNWRYFITWKLYK